MGDSTAEVTDENRDAAQSEKSKAMDAISDGTEPLKLVLISLVHRISPWVQHLVNA